MRIGLASYVCKIKNISFNMAQIEKAMRESQGKVDLLCFGEAYLQGFDSLCWDYAQDTYDMGENTLKIGNAIVWVAAYFGIMLFYTFLNVAVWRKVFPIYAEWINTIVIIICAVGFICLLKSKYEINIVSNVTPTGILLAVFCSVSFFLLLDKGLDPVFESFFPQSEQDYQETIQRLIKSPVTSMIQVCIIAPVIEEILMRGFVLGGLKNTYGVMGALFISALFFAILHFNMVQTLSAFVCGIVLGLLYIKTNSVPCCIIAHCGYNLISYVTMILGRDRI